jgi:hypothetical protein
VEARKGIDVLVQTLASLRDFPVIRFEVFGNLGEVHGMPAQEYIKNQLTTAHHVDCVVHGAVRSNELWPHLKKHKLLLVMPTLLENQPMTIILAYQHGIPLVSYDVGGVAGMLSEASRPLVLIPPEAQQLRARLSIALRNGIAFVPELNAEMFSAQQNWVTLVREAFATSKIRRARTTSQALPAPDDLYTTVNLVGNVTTDSLAAQLSRSKSALGLVLLLQPGFVVRAAALLPARLCMAELRAGGAAAGEAVAAAAIPAGISEHAIPSVVVYVVAVLQAD